MTSIVENLQSLRTRVEEASRASQREPDSVCILAVSKTFPAEAVESAWRAGQHRFGENRVQEAAAKIPACPEEIEWHLIGPLQSNKARKAVELFHVIQTLDRPKIIHRVGRIADELDKPIRVYLQVNVGDEPQKHGVAPERIPKLLEIVNRYPRLRCEGLMCIPPYAADPELTRPYFRRLRTLLDGLADTGLSPGHQLSMGMSHDYPIAIEEGATLIRVGTAIFGAREKTRTNRE